MSTVTICLLVYLLPLVPAFVFYGGRVGSRAKLTGKLAGFAVDLGGGIAAYAAVFLMGIHFVAPLLHSPAARILNVRGTMKFSATPPKPPDVLAEMFPPVLDIPDGKSFEWKVPIVDGTEHIFVHPAGYEAQTLYLGGDVAFGAPNYKHHIDAAGTLIFDEPIVFKQSSNQPGGAS